MQLFEIVALAAIALAIAAGGGLALVYRQLQRYRRSQHVIMGSRGTVDIVEHVTAVDEKLTNVRLALEDLTLAARDHDVRIDGSLSRVGIVRFDAYHDLGGRQSTAIALLNSLGDGVVITTVVSRDFARMYVKLIKDEAPDIPLAPEEAQAIDQARGSTPFTIRPRVEGAAAEGTSTQDEMEVAVEGTPISDGLPGLRDDGERELARENRRRRRARMPLVEDEVVPSALGWEAPETPTPPTASLAERFVEERKKTLASAADAEERSPAPPEDDEGSDEL